MVSLHAHGNMETHLFITILTCIRSVSSSATVLKANSTVTHCHSPAFLCLSASNPSPLCLSRAENPHLPLLFSRVLPRQFQTPLALNYFPALSLRYTEQSSVPDCAPSPSCPAWDPVLQPGPSLSCPMLASLPLYPNPLQ